ncbi:MAG: MFS transporter [Zetaproteobacteria bacterium CG_4_9_14_3_um_filter_49_83]|nr:MAG: hypothetical protein AUJ56_02185 [Zetaproteobacteria bacterium CG1_02_49_23]PIQ30013.1 MAG: MFS transporter [Zetaproteobacteria bacterium CG17_big_fil_post_rev_8_21_14_2_50_50_13]PIV29033.1 MAG: MFS transporter [Zetaproteobacteria bacterium CG02_land_8_20_14_3_00_50_9]PIY56039.1 MAG: MFS transporter [Zetaproteobacteria bacterium CG_4_10_14_0_8_um_filter_49_80]PJA36284.1 MAG: MFS transporter [Zetaproteobacteria bacterium CG_4_9_14_3_um_filter_49_83]
MPESLHAIRLFYAAYFAAMGLILPYFPVYLSSLGLSAAMVGVVAGLLTLAKLIAPPFAGLWLDKKQLPVGGFIAVASLAAAICMATTGWLSSSIVALAIGVFVFGMLYAAILPLADSISIHLSEMELSDYGRLRVWGSLGFIAASGLGGWILAPLQIGLFPFLLAGLMLFMAMAGKWFPAMAAPSSEEVTYAFDLRLYGLFVLAFLMQASHGAYYGFFSLYLLDHGFVGWQVGGLWVIGVLAEVVLMWMASAWVQKALFIPVMSACLILASLRWLGLAMSTELFVLVALQLLHAASFAAFHISAVTHVRKWAPANRHASAQGWYSAAGFGLGSTVGIMGCGIIVQTAGFSAAFLVCAVIALCGLIPLKWMVKTSD